MTGADGVVAADPPSVIGTVTSWVAETLPLNPLWSADDGVGW